MWKEALDIVLSVPATKTSGSQLEVLNSLYLHRHRTMSADTTTTTQYASAALQALLRLLAHRKERQRQGSGHASIATEEAAVEGLLNVLKEDSFEATDTVKSCDFSKGLKLILRYLL